MEPEAAPTMTQPNSMMDAADGRSAAVSENNAYPNFAPCCIKFWQYTHPLWAWSWVKVDHSPPPAQEWGHGNSSAAKLLGLSPETSKGHLKNPYKYGDSPNKSWFYPNTVSFGGIPNSRNVSFLQIFPAPNSPRPSPEPSLWNPVEPDLALHQSLPDFLRNPLRNPVERDVALRQSLPHRVVLNLTWLCTQASQTFSGTLLNLTRRLHQSLPEPSPDPAPAAGWRPH